MKETLEALLQAIKRAAEANDGSNVGYFANAYATLEHSTRPQFGMPPGLLSSMPAGIEQNGSLE